MCRWLAMEKDMKLLLTGISAVALMAMPALAQGNGNGQGNGNRGGQAASAAPANPGNGNANRGNRGGGSAERRANRGGGPPQARGNRPGSPPQARGNGNRGGPPAARANRGGGPPAGRGNRNRGGNVDFTPLRGIVDYQDASRIARGCPPGLARKYNGCRPPGLARQQDGARYRNNAPAWWGLGGLFGGGRGSYFYDDGFLLRIGDGGRISGYIPLLGGALAIGSAWPDDYRYSRMPDYHESYYGLGQRSRYRYADNVVYRLDPETAAITSIAALLTGDEFVVGQPAPRGYDVYNVPRSYRDRYYDRPDARYRYSDGYVYEIDPETMLVASAIELLI